MRIAILLLTCFFLFSCKGKKAPVYPWQEKLSLQQKGLKGSVKSIVEYHYHIVDSSGAFEKEMVEKEQELFDSQGYTIESNTTNYSPADSYRSKNLYSYDRNHKIIEEKLFNRFSKTPQIIRYYYDEKGNDTLEVEQYQNRNFGARTVCIYDEDNRLIERRHYPVGKYTDSNYIHPYFTHFNYRKYINKIEATTFSADGELKSKCLYKYDRDGNLVEQSRYDGTENLTDRTVFTLTGSNNGSITYGPDSTIISKGTNIEDSFDQYGNALKISKFINNKLILLTVREIEYYR